MTTECALIEQNFLLFTLITTTISITQDTASEVNLFSARTPFKNTTLFIAT